ncbi:Septum formation protein Maf [Thalassoglobus neptunius]|uniref:Nucleoside triphosphate pyrophosphatase n=1 Tax=Thalassoglobus neptunius TaxID=1938619 RepID=A0A5C5W9P0_9PLAN|nr:Maf family protein [Thalassoglobus neptunius]TWT47003.1 Septum formation protein Maf [Thalassoglobus neptunius]
MSHLYLGSQSPQRRTLLRQIVPPDLIAIRPPLDNEEAGFEGIKNREEILDQLSNIALTKCEDVAQQIQLDQSLGVITADTIVLAQCSDSSFAVLGKPQGENWRETVRKWFLEYYSGTTHEVITAVCILQPDGRRTTGTVTSRVTFHSVDPQLLDWYLSTEEPLGKAGGYGIQASGSLFVRSVEGSLTNVIGLPLEWVWSALRDCGVINSD